MHPELFLEDLLAKPACLRSVADAIDRREAFDWSGVRRSDRILLTGMGSSWFAAQVAALRLRRSGITAVAEIASVERTWSVADDLADDLAVVAISASGGSTETLDLVRSLDGARLIALTNSEASALRDLANLAGDRGATVDLLPVPSAAGSHVAPSCTRWSRCWHSRSGCRASISTSPVRAKPLPRRSITFSGHATCG